MNGFILADLALNMVEIGIRADEIRSKVNEKKLEGATEQEVAAFLVGWRDAAITQAQSEIDKL